MATYTIFSTPYLATKTVTGTADLVVAGAYSAGSSVGSGATFAGGAVWGSPSNGMLFITTDQFYDSKAATQYIYGHQLYLKFDTSAIGTGETIVNSRIECGLQMYTGPQASATVELHSVGPVSSPPTLISDFRAMSDWSAGTIIQSASILANQNPTKIFDDNAAMRSQVVKGGTTWFSLQTSYTRTSPTVTPSGVGVTVGTSGRTKTPVLTVITETSASNTYVCNASFITADTSHLYYTSSTSLADALLGPGGTGSFGTNSGYIGVADNVAKGGAHSYSVYEQIFGFDTSAIPSGETVVDVTMNVTNNNGGIGDTAISGRTTKVEVFSVPQPAGTTADWRNSSQLAALTKVAVISLDLNDAKALNYGPNILPTLSAINSAINKGGKTYFLFALDTARTNTQAPVDSAYSIGLAGDTLTVVTLSGSGVSANAGNGAGTGTAYDAVAAILANDAGATATGTAYDATASTASFTNAAAVDAAGTGTAYDATVTILANTAASTGTGVAGDAAPSVSAADTGATGAGSAYDAGLSASLSAPGLDAASLGTAFDATVSTIVSWAAQAAAGTGTAYDAVISLVVQTYANAEVATGSGLAGDLGSLVLANADYAPITGQADNAPALLYIYAGIASITGLSYDPGYTASANIQAEVAVGSGAAGDPSSASTDRSNAKRGFGIVRTRFS